MTVRRATLSLDRRVARAAVFLISIVTVVACGTQARPASVGFWNALRIFGDEVEHFATLGEMSDAADVVGVGRIVSFDMGRTLQGDSLEDVVGFGAATLELDDVIGSQLPDGPFVVEFLLPGRPADFETLVKGLQRELPVGPILVFLREKGGDEAGRFRLVNSRGLWIATTRFGLDAPLASADDQDQYADEIGHRTELDQLVVYLKSR